MKVDLIMILIIYFGFSEFLMLPTVETIMWLIGFLFLMYIGIESIKEAKQPLDVAGSNVGKKSLIIVASGILFGILIHDVILMGIISYTRKFVNHTFTKWTSMIAGFLLIGFSLYFAFLFIGEVKHML